MPLSLSFLFCNPHFRAVFQLSLLMLVVTSSLYAGYNVSKIDGLRYFIQTEFNQIYFVSRRFAQFYNNAESVPLTKGIHQRDGVSAMVSQPGEVKELSDGVRMLRDQLESKVGDNVWTIAIFENPATYAFFDPLRKEYQDRYVTYQEDDVIQRIVKLEQLEHTYANFYGCNIKLSEAYQEQGTGEWVRTVYYPVFNHRTLNAVLAVDLKVGLRDVFVERFNRARGTVLNVRSEPSLYQHSVEIPCSDNQTIQVGFDLRDILARTLLPSLLLALLSHLLIQIFQQWRRNITHDTMTGFYRRDYYEPRLAKLSQFSVLIIDIDMFKVINDTFGHGKGDEVIAQVAKRIADQLRNNDVAIRWGGEEFVLIFDAMKPHHLLELAQRIRDMVASERICDLNVTISIGGYNSTGTPFLEAYRSADVALYESKRNGRNQVTISKDPQSVDRSCRET